MNKGDLLQVMSHCAALINSRLTFIDKGEIVIFYEKDVGQQIKVICTKDCKMISIYNGNLRIL
jgi:hypothetical protein